MSMVVRMATDQDQDGIVKLLKKGKLNYEGIEDHITHFLVVEHQDHQEIVGTAGLEIVKDQVGLLRSLALDSAWLDAQAGMELVRILLSFAVQKGLQEIYLLTRSAAFFHYFGFQAVKEEAIPAVIKASSHFQQHQPGLSTVMVYKRQLANQI